ncbi:hypothetical protein ACC785_39150, partial [Rhizobium ruizarguesonis]
RIVFGVDLFSADLEKFFGERNDAATSGLAATSIARYGMRAAPVFFPGADQDWPRFGGAFFLNPFLGSIVASYPAAS